MRASHLCVVKDVVVAEGASVDTGATLVTFEAQ
jgi:biotin carboxyl carrier protein